MASKNNLKGFPLLLSRCKNLLMLFSNILITSPDNSTLCSSYSNKSQEQQLTTAVYITYLGNKLIAAHSLPVSHILTANDKARYTKLLKMSNFDLLCGIFYFNLLPITWTIDCSVNLMLITADKKIKLEMIPTTSAMPELLCYSEEQLWTCQGHH